MAPHPNDNHNTALISVAAVSVSLSWAGLMGRMISMRMMRLTVRPDDLLLFFAFVSSCDSSALPYLIFDRHAVLHNLPLQSGVCFASRRSLTNVLISSQSSHPTYRAWTTSFYLEPCADFGFSEGTFEEPLHRTSRNPYNTVSLCSGAPSTHSTFSGKIVCTLSSPSHFRNSAFPNYHCGHHNYHLRLVDRDFLCSSL